MGTIMLKLHLSFLNSMAAVETSERAPSASRTDLFLGWLYC